MMDFSDLGCERLTRGRNEANTPHPTVGESTNNDETIVVVALCYLSLRQFFHLVQSPAVL